MTACSNAKYNRSYLDRFGVQQRPLHLQQRHHPSSSSPHEAALTTGITALG